MGLGTTKGASAPSIFVDLKTSAAKGQEGVGFRQETGRTTDGEGKVHRQTVMHDYVDGHIQSFRAKEEPTYDDKNINEWIGYLTLSEQGQPNVCVRFPMERGSGRRMIGLINAATLRGEDKVFLRATFADAGTKLGDKTLEKAQAFLTMRANDSQGERINPVYCNDDGSMMLDKDGEPVPLPMTKYVKVGKQEVPDSSAADAVVAATALSLMTHFEALREARKQGQAEGDDGINPAEAAAAAAAPRG